jgi:hypothetical protein
MLAFFPALGTSLGDRDREAGDGLVVATNVRSRDVLILKMGPQAGSECFRGAGTRRAHYH